MADHDRLRSETEALGQLLGNTQSHSARIHVRFHLSAGDGHFDERYVVRHAERDDLVSIRSPEAAARQVQLLVRKVDVQQIVAKQNEPQNSIKSCALMD